jgi:hypothetical protein
MSSSTSLHLPRTSADNPLQTSGAIQSTGAAVLTLKVAGEWTLFVFTDKPEHLRSIATKAAELADRLESAQVVASCLKPVAS